MQDKLRSDIERQHAPQRLIDETIEKLHTPKKKNTTLYGIAGALAAAVLFVCIQLLPAGDQMRYNEVNVPVLRDMTLMNEYEVERVNLGEGTLVIKSSETTSVAPEELLSGEISVIEDCEVYLGRSSDEIYYMAAFSLGEIQYYFQARDCEKKEFEEFIEKFIKN